MTAHTEERLRPDEAGEGATIMVLHGGGGPATVRGLAAEMAADHHVLTPTHPGWDGTARRAGIDDIPTLATCYLDLLAERGESAVSVVGSSIGGWLAAEMAVQDAARDHRIATVVLVDAAGVEVPDEPIRDFYGLDAHGVAEYSFYDSAKFYRDPATMTADEIAVQQGNLATMSDLTHGGVMSDPTLLGRLSSIAVPTLVIWGDSDGIFTPGYGRSYAAAIPGAEFTLIEHAGHLPQLERPELTVPVITDFLAQNLG